MDAADHRAGYGADDLLRVEISRVEQGGDIQARLGPFDPARAGHLVGAAADHHLSRRGDVGRDASTRSLRSEEHTSELQSLMRISYAVFCLKKKKHNIRPQTNAV